MEKQLHAPIRVLLAAFILQLVSALVFLYIQPKVYALMGANGDFLLNLAKVPVALLGIFVTYLFAKILCHSPRFLRLKPVQFIAKNQMAIYLLHAMALYIIFSWLKNASIIPSLLVLFSSIAVICLSSAVAWIMRKWRLAWMLGEK